MTGIYKIENLINHKIYIGQSVNIEKRWEDHKFYEYNENTVLQKAFKKYGINNFSFSVIEECSKEELDEKEIYWIKYYNSYKEGYNMTTGGSAGQILNYEKILLCYNQTQSIHKTAELLCINRDSVRQVLDYYNIDYNKIISQPQPIIMIDPYSLEELKVFMSIKDAANYLNISDATIRKYLKGNLQTAGGYYWRLVGENKNFTPLKQTQKIQNTSALQIIQYDVNHNIINTYKSLSQANKAIGKSRSNTSIKKACEENILVYGYYWGYKQ